MRILKSRKGISKGMTAKTKSRNSAGGALRIAARLDEPDAPMQASQSPSASDSNLSKLRESLSRMVMKMPQPKGGRGACRYITLD